MALYRRADELPKKEAAPKKEAVVVPKKEAPTIDDVIENTVALWHGWNRPPE